jgi:hypothetical protein
MKDAKLTNILKFKSEKPILKKYSNITMWPLEEIGSGSVIPWINPRSKCSINSFILFI